MRSALRRSLGWLLAIAILFFLGQLVVSSWDQVTRSGYVFRPNWPLVALSLGMLVAGRGFAVEAWRRIVLLLGDALSYRAAFRAWFISNLARYIPGNIWQVATMVVLVEREGVSKTNSILAQSIYALIALSIAGLLGLFLLPLGELAPYVAGLLVLLVLVLAQPRVFEWMTAASQVLLQSVRAGLRQGGLAGLRRLNLLDSFRAALALPHSRHSFGHGLLPPLCSAVMWTTNGCAYYLFVRSLFDLPLDALPAFAAMNAAAYFIGYVSFITPSGLGFREGALALFLSTYFPAPLAVALAFVTRLWSTAGEFLGVVIAVLPQTAPPAASKSPVPILRGRQD